MIYRESMETKVNGKQIKATDGRQPFILVLKAPEAAAQVIMTASNLKMQVLICRFHFSKVMAEIKHRWTLRDCLMVFVCHSTNSKLVWLASHWTRDRKTLISYWLRLSAKWHTKLQGYWTKKSNTLCDEFAKCSIYLRSMLYQMSLRVHIFPSISYGIKYHYSAFKNIVYKIRWKCIYLLRGCPVFLYVFHFSLIFIW